MLNVSVNNSLGITLLGYNTFSVFFFFAFLIHTTQNMVIHCGFWKTAHNNEPQDSISKCLFNWSVFALTQHWFITEVKDTFFCLFAWITFFAWVKVLQIWDQAAKV